VDCAVIITKLSTSKRELEDKIAKVKAQFCATVGKLPIGLDELQLVGSKEDLTDGASKSQVK